MNDLFLEQLERIAGKDLVRMKEPMALHTTFRTGGEAEYFVLPTSLELIRDVVSLCREEKQPFYIIGNGSNLLVSDTGYEGVIIQLYQNFRDITIDGNRITAQAGASLSLIASKACQANLSGFEFAAGIPGTIGGAVVMNAGAFGGEMKQIVRHVRALDKNGREIILENEKLEFGYRSSVLQKGYLVLEVELELEQGEENEILERTNELKRRRREKQPLEYPSAGSTFKRPQGNYAGKLIMEAGLGGYQIGGAQVSNKHCGFIINSGGATSEDVFRLIEHVRETVQNHSGILLEPEVKFLGNFGK